jgi:hypothetical protein
LSGGGGGPLARLADGSRRVSLRWPGRLPVPVLTGDTAVYRGVLPGVDLRVRATVDGFAEVLVVRTRAAAADPRLARIRLAVAAAGVSVKAAAGGGLSAVDSRGRAVFTAGRPVMWDSSAGAGTRPVPMRLRVGRHGVTVIPDRGMLTGPRTRFPVFIDPAVSLGLAAWGNITAAAPDQTMAQDPFRSEGAKAGYGCDVNGCYRYRSMFGFGLGGLYGTHILGATFGITMYHSWSCSPTPVELWQTGGIDVNSTTWNNSSWSGRLDTQSAEANCGSPAVWMVFSGGLAAQVQNGASNGWPAITVGLKAPDEGDVNEWKRFNADPVLSVTYNSIPNPPDTLTVDGKPCATGDSRPYIADLTPTLTAHVSDPDAGQLLEANFYGAPLGGTRTHWVSQGNLANGGTANIKIPAGIVADGGVYTFQAYTDDSIDNSGWSAACEFGVDVTPPGPPTVSSPDYPDDKAFHGVVGRTGYFTFTAPAAHPEDVAFYKYGFNSCNQPTCAVTVAADPASHNATIAYTPVTDGPNNLFVWTMDKAGNLSTEVTYQFDVHSTTFTSPITGQQAGAPAARWPLTDGTGTTAADATGNGNTAVLSDAAYPVSWVNPGRRGTGPALHLDGGEAATAGPITGRNPDTGASYTVRTDRSFTVMAWVRLTGGTANWPVAVSLDGTKFNGFTLQYATNVNRWAFTMATSDSTPFNADWATAMSVTPVLGEWTHLAGVYDAGAGQMTFYVNGVPAATAPHAGTWTASGPLQIGMGLYNGVPSSPWRGDISDVRLYDRVLSGAEIAAIVNTPVLAGDWGLGEGTGTTAHDTSSATPPADGTLTGATTWVPVDPANARPDGGLPPGATALRLDGSTAAVTIPPNQQPIIDTTHSFTVAAWVRLTGGTANWPVAVGVDGTNFNGFTLQYATNTGRWAFAMATSDTAPFNADWAEAMSVTPAIGTWTHLAAVYDATTGQMRLYVDGVLQASATHTSTWQAAGPLRIGMGEWNGTPASLWHGDLASVEVYSGVLSDQQIATLAGV